MTVFIRNLNIESHDRLPCGHRDFVCLVGRKWVRLVAIASGETGRISVAQFRASLHGRSRDVARSQQVARRLRRNAKAFGALDTKAVKDALRMLTSTTRQGAQK